MPKHRVRGRGAVALVVALIGGGCGGADTPPNEEPAAAAESPRPAGADAIVGSWTLLLIDMTDGEDLEPIGDAAPNLTFTAEADPTGSRGFHGSGGCNRMNGAYNAGSTGRISFGAGAAMTMMACPEDVMRVERMFAMGLEAARTFTIEEGRLSIDFGGGVLIFERAGD